MALFGVRCADHERVRRLREPRPVHEDPLARVLLELLRAAQGMWKDRKDLPDFKALRRSMDRDFRRKSS